MATCAPTLTCKRVRRTGCLQGACFSATSVLIPICSAVSASPRPSLAHAHPLSPHHVWCIMFGPAASAPLTPPPPPTISLYPRGNLTGGVAVNRGLAAIGSALRVTSRSRHTRCRPGAHGTGASPHLVSRTSSTSAMLPFYPLNTRSASCVAHSTTLCTTLNVYLNVYMLLWRAGVRGDRSLRSLSCVIYALACPCHVRVVCKGL